jgi:hypothetical protein
MATNRQTVDRRDCKSLVIGVYHSILQKASGKGVHHEQFLHGRSSGVVCASLGQMKNQKKLLVHVM